MPQSRRSCWAVLIAPRSCLTQDMLKEEEVRLSDPVRGRESYAQCHVFETSDLQDQTTWTAMFIEPFYNTSLLDHPTAQIQLARIRASYALTAHLPLPPCTSILHTTAAFAYRHHQKRLVL